MKASARDEAVRRPPPKLRFGRGGCAVLAAALLIWAPLVCAASVAGEYQVKAAFLYNFAKFVDWPGDGGQGMFVLCVLGADPFGGAIDAVAGKPVGGRTIQVRRLASADGAGACQMLFISSSEADGLGKDLGAVRGKPVLTVGDTPGFAERGVVINLYVEQSKVRFEINIDAAKRAQLNISSQLLRLARITKD